MAALTKIADSLYSIGSYEKAFPDGTSIEEMLFLSQRAGYDFFEISIDRTDKRIDRLFDDSFSNQAIEAIQHTGHRIGSVCLSAIGTYTLGHPDPVIANKGKKILEKAIQFATKLGIRIIQIPACDVPKNCNHTPDTNSRFIRTLRDMVQIAASESVMLTLENMEDDYMPSISKCIKLVNEISSPYFQLYSDAGNAYSAAVISHGNITEDLFSGVGHYAAFHLKETRPDKYGGLFYGEGYVPFEDIIQTTIYLGVRRYVMEYWYTGNPNWIMDLSTAYSLCVQWIKAAKERKKNVL